MCESAIRVENLAKRYRVGVACPRYKSLRDTIASAAKWPTRAARSLLSRNSAHRDAGDTFWALKDVSFEIKRGDVVGVIGRNGAGKSTLLKILSRITEPTRGRAEIRGRVGSLLEVGTGFHPELTGRENIYLNGAILGMKKTEIERKFDEIVAFAEIDAFIDTMVKYYSSGMHLRLAFAVAAHLEPEILLMDEVLAVGDSAFQKKCLGKMGDVAKQGRTVVFVSHNMAAIKALCGQAILLDRGQIQESGRSDVVTSRYLSSAMPRSGAASVNIESRPRTRGSGAVTITNVLLEDSSGGPAVSFSVWEQFTVVLSAKSTTLPQFASFWVLIQSIDGLPVLSAFQYDVMPLMRIQCVQSCVRVVVAPNGLLPGTYSLSVGVFGPHPELFDWVDQAAEFEIRGEFVSGKPFDNRLGLYSVPMEWRVG